MHEEAVQSRRYSFEGIQHVDQIQSWKVQGIEFWHNPLCQSERYFLVSVSYSII